MNIVARILVGLVAFEHLYILFIEMFSWEKLGKKTFKGVLPDELFAQTTAMAANQGLYNGFLAAGLIWSFFISESNWRSNVSIFFLSCVILAGSYGALTLSTKIFFTQAVPGILAIVFVLIARMKSTNL